MSARRLSTIGLVLLASLLALPRTGSAQEPPFRFQYAAKVVCVTNIPGTSAATGSVVPGGYLTVVNIHNPNLGTVRIRMKVAETLLPFVSEFVPTSLDADFATKVDCSNIAQDFGFTPFHGVEGFLVVESSRSLDVTAVYSAADLEEGDVRSLAVERVAQRRIAPRP